jgi:hypothetical protein
MMLCSAASLSGALVASSSSAMLTTLLLRTGEKLRVSRSEVARLKTCDRTGLVGVDALQQARASCHLYNTNNGIPTWNQSVFDDIQTIGYPYNGSCCRHTTTTRRRATSALPAACTATLVGERNRNTPYMGTHLMYNIKPMTSRSRQHK